MPESVLLQAHGAVIGEEAHIRSARSQGPRYDETYPKEKLDTYDNLVLLCPTHHTMIDKDGGTAWSVADLERIKVDHERLIDAMTGMADLKTRGLEEILAAQISFWEEHAQLNNWKSLSGWLNGPRPIISKDDLHALRSLSEWLLRRRGPEGYPRISTALDQFRNVLECLLELIQTSFETRDHDQLLELPRQHKRIDWDPPLYTRLISDFNVKGYVLWMLMMELTRSANLVITAVSAELDPLYRMAEGYVLMEEGDAFSGIFLVRLEYDSSESATWPRQYSLQALMERTAAELGGGDPRRQRGIDAHNVDVAEWASPRS